MGPSLSIAIRFLVAKKRSMLMSLGGIAFGVGFFIVTQAQVSGFQDFFIETILGTEGAVKVTDRYQDSLVPVSASRPDGRNTAFYYADKANTRYVEGVENPDELIESLEVLENFSAASPVLVGNMSITSPMRTESGQIYGIDLDAHLQVTNLKDQMKIGSLNEFRGTPSGIILGMKLRNYLRAQLGDSVIVQILDQKRRYRVVGVFESGVSAIDDSRVFMHMQEARSLMKQPHGVSFVQVQVKDRDLAPLDAEAIRRLTNHAAASWQEREKSWLGVFKALQISAAITVSTIILISGLGMFNTLVMIVMEKTREIAILRSMGYTRQDIMNVFFLQGAIVLVFGTLIGFAFGAGITYGISKMHIGIRGIFTADTYIVSWSVYHYIYAALTATVIVMIASLAPARRAARLIPGDMIRGDFSMSGAEAKVKEVALECRGLHKHLGEGEMRVHVLKGVDVRLYRGEISAVVGPSGCGKSTLLYLLGLLDEQESGDIIVEDEVVPLKQDERRTALRGEHIGFVFQFHFLLPEFSALENVMLPMKKLGKLSQAEMEARAKGLLEEVGLGEKTHRLPSQLSGGEQQRVAIARSLANQPAVLLADEPTGNLDVKNSLMIFEVLTKLAKEKRQAVLIVTHNPELAEKCDRILRMEDGLFVD